MDDDLQQRQQQLDADAGLPPQEVLQRVQAATRGRRDEALAELAAVAGDQELLEVYGLDMAELRRGIDLDRAWSLS